MPESAVTAVRERARADAALVERAQEIEGRTHHDVIAFTEAIAEQVGDEARWFHYGLTSSDVVDTGLALQLRAAGAELLAGLDRALAAVLERALEHRGTPCMGRTHGVHAEPTTFGLKLLGWWYDLRRAPRSRRARVRGRRRRQALRRRRRLRQRRPARRGAGPRGARPRPRGRRDAGRRARPPRRAAGGARDPRQLARPLRDGDPPPAAQRGARGGRAVRARSEGLLRDAAQAQPDHLRAHQRPGARAARQRASPASRTCRSGTSATSRTPRPSASC